MQLLNSRIEKYEFFCYKTLIILQALVLATLLFPFRFANYMLMISAVVWLLDFNYKRKIESLKIQKRWVFCLLLILYYLICLIGFFYSENRTTAFAVLERKTMVLGGALFFLTLNDRFFTLKDFKLLQYAFIIGNIIYIFWTFVMAFSAYMDTGDILNLYYINLAKFQHPSYIALFLVFSNILILYQRFNSKEVLKKFFRILLDVFWVINSIYIILLQSKAGVISLIILVLILMIRLFYKYPKKMIFAIFLLVILIPCIYFLMPDKLNRVEGSITDIKTMNDSKIGGINSRLIAWKASYDLFKKHPLIGYGIGDVQVNLNDYYQTHQYHYSLKKEFNAHNQYFETLLQSGIIGLFSVLSFLIFPIFGGGHKSYINILIIAIVTLSLYNFLVESMLEKQCYTLFLFIFLPLLYYVKTHKEIVS